MEQIIVIILFHEDHLLHKNKEERKKGTWPRVGTECYPAGMFLYWLHAWLVKICRAGAQSPMEAACLMQLCYGFAETATWGAFAFVWTLLSPSLPVTHSCMCIHAHNHTCGYWCCLNTTPIRGPS